MDPASAKQFLISRIVEEAGVEQVDLSDIEKKMLYFTETQPSLPDIYEINTEFEQNYDSDEYENKISNLLQNARARDSAHAVQLKEMWADAITTLKHEDHYILVMVARAFPDYGGGLVPTRQARNYSIYVAIGIAVILGCIALAVLRR
jgi:hypothetical protein